jgi:leader peptidase (prepilin peptidase)/N-methyltransferase
MAELLSESPGIFAAVVFAFALIIGSFLNVVVYRLPIMMERAWRAEIAEATNDEPAADLPDGMFNLIFPGSRCPSCGKQIKPWQNVPVLSYILLSGRCAECNEAISTRYPLVEAVTAALAAIVAWRFGFGWEAAMGITLTLFLVPITLIDFDHQLIPDSLVMPLLWIGLTMSLYSPVEGSEVLFISSHDAIIGAMAGYLSLWSVYWLYKLVTGKEGMGYGDFKLLAALGAWLGYQEIFSIIMMSAFVGATLGIVLILFRGRDHQVPMPFGPFLAAAGWITMLYGDAIRQVVRLPF